MKLHQELASECRADVPFVDQFARDVLHGLGKRRKTLPSKYLYDDRGSALFEQICELEEYYLTRAELAIMDRHVHEMAARLGPACLLVELGSGSGLKTHLLLGHLARPAAYVPVEIASGTLAGSTARLSKRYPSLEVLPVCAGFTRRFTVPHPTIPAKRTAVYFPGSTIGNFRPREAAPLLKRMAELCGRGGALLIGVDLKKEARVLERAYDDCRGVTAAFNLNLLTRINHELRGNFRLEQFRHRAIYDRLRGRVEMHLESLRPQTVQVAGQRIVFSRGETICTEYSHKYALGEFQRLAAAAGWQVEKVWLDPQRRFSVQYLTT